MITIVSETIKKNCVISMRDHLNARSSQCEKATLPSYHMKWEMLGWFVPFHVYRHRGLTFDVILVQLAHDEVFQHFSNGDVLPWI